MTVALLLALGFGQGALPPAAEYLFPSLPRALQPLLRSREEAARHAPEPVWFVQRIPAGPSATLWSIGNGCDEFGCRHLSLYLQRGADFEPVGEFAGRLEGDARDVERSPPPLTVVVEQPGGRLTRQPLVFEGGAYRAGKPVHRLRDPLTRAPLSKKELDRLAREDLRVGRFTLAAGRFGTLCKAGCDAEERQLEGEALLRADLLPQAEATLRAVVHEDPTRGPAWLALGDALVAQGMLAPAREAYGEAARRGDKATAAKARAHLAKLATAPR